LRVLGKINRFLLALSGYFADKTLRNEGADRTSLVDARTASGELEARSNIGRGAKSKHFERLARRLRTVAFSIALQRGLVIANWHNVV